MCYVSWSASQEHRLGITVFSGLDSSPWNSLLAQTQTVSHTRPQYPGACAKLPWRQYGVRVYVLVLGVLRYGLHILAEPVGHAHRHIYAHRRGCTMPAAKHELLLLHLLGRSAPVHSRALFWMSKGTRQAPRVADTSPAEASHCSTQALAAALFSLSSFRSSYFSLLCYLFPFDIVRFNGNVTSLTDSSTHSSPCSVTYTPARHRVVQPCPTIVTLSRSLCNSEPPSCYLSSQLYPYECQERLVDLFTTGDEVTVDLTKDLLTNHSTGERHSDICFIFPYATHRGVGEYPACPKLGCIETPRREHPRGRSSF